ncbi:ATP-dependent helicase [Neorhizobium galegae]|uniref:ATP-dependent helicase n=1 Tax=Neorhizobium galegae TaxID=399 RepID=UPI0021074021|nr:ATP-dependent helicase [Neorhizobium galegae]
MSELTELSEHQNAIVGLPLTPISVTACAGAGKTKTAVHRLAAMRALCQDRHAIVTLLSFSNVAVDTFQTEYGRLSGGAATSPYGVEIDTLDSFFTRNVLRPHGHLAMKCNRSPFLVEGDEPFLKHFTVWDGAKPIPATDVAITIENDDWVFKAGRWVKSKLPPAVAAAGIAKLGTVGAYHHDAGRYWVLRALRENPFLLRALVRRYPHILIDEAQDIEPVHEAVLSLMMTAGSQVSLIGDVNQGIFEFSGATGEFLGGYGNRTGVTMKTLERNYRSVPSIVEIANTLSGRKDAPDRKGSDTLCGAFFVPTNDEDRDGMLKVFGGLLDQAKLPHKSGVVVCRSSAVADGWAGGSEKRGQGVIKAFALAAVARDKLKKLDAAFAHVSVGVIGLLDPDNHDLLAKLKQGVRPETKAIRRILWRFTRESSTGLPSAALLADTAWHGALVPRVKALIVALEKDHGLKATGNLGRRLAKTGLANAPLVDVSNALEDNITFRISTVHKVKGESLSGVFYAARKNDILALLGGPATEEGRIGYVAVTRARDLFVLGVPTKCLEELKPKLIAAGFAPVPP